MFEKPSRSECKAVVPFSHYPDARCRGVGRTVPGCGDMAICQAHIAMIECGISVAIVRGDCILVVEKG